MIDAANTKRRTIRIPIWHERYLKLWAWAKGQTPTALLGNIAQARIEANQEQIDRMIAGCAESMGVTVDDLEAKILGEDDADD